MSDRLLVTLILLAAAAIVAVSLVITWIEWLIDVVKQHKKGD